VVDRRPTRA